MAWCSRTTSPGGPTVGDLDSPGVPEGANDRLLVIPPDPTHLEVEVSPPSVRAVTAVTHGSTSAGSSRSVTPCWVRRSSISPLARFSWAAAGMTTAATAVKGMSTTVTPAFLPGGISAGSLTVAQMQRRFGGRGT